MAVLTVTGIEHKCGHTQERDLSDKPAGERAGFAAWLAKQPCTECWKKTKSKEISKELAAERAEIQQEALNDQERSQLPVLRGSGKQIEWAVRLRFEFLQDLYVNHVESGQMSEDEFDTNVLSLARRISRARWWIDNREAGDDLLALLADPGNLDEDINENPY